MPDIGQIFSLRNEPSQYYRDFDNDYPASRSTDDSIPNQCMRLASAALPLFSLYKPFGTAVSIASNSLRCLTSLSENIKAYKTGGTSEIILSSGKTMVFATTLVLTFVAPVFSLFLVTGEDIVLNAEHLYHALDEKDYKKAFDKCAHIVTSALYLSIFFTTSLEVMVIAFSAQILLGLYQSTEEFNHGHYLEGGSRLLFSVIRINQLFPHIATLQHKWSLQNKTIKFKEESGKHAAVFSTIQSAGIQKSSPSTDYARSDKDDNRPRQFNGGPTKYNPLRHVQDDIYIDYYGHYVDQYGNRILHGFHIGDD